MLTVGRLSLGLPSEQSRGGYIAVSALGENPLLCHSLLIGRPRPVRPSWAHGGDGVPEEQLETETSGR